MARLSLALAWIIVAVGSPAAVAQNAEQDVRNVARAGAEGTYTVHGDAIVARNGPRYHNRPLYCNHMPAFVLAGDRPHLRLARDPYVYGCFMLAYLRDGKAVWLHEAQERSSFYRPGRMEWRISDPLCPGVQIVLETVPLAREAGAAVRLRVEGANKDDQVLFAFGGATRRPNPAQPNIAWSLDPRGNPALQTRGFVPEDCTDNVVRIDDDLFKIQPPAYEPAANLPLHTVAGRCSEPATLIVADAATWRNPTRLTAATDHKLPLACGTVHLQAGANEIFWAIEAFVGEQVADRTRLSNPRQAYQAGLERVETIGRQVLVDTPDPRLNAAVAAVCHAIDGAFYPPIYVHGGMLWNVPFPGWRTLYGPTAFGWHENVKEQAKFYLANQETDDSRRKPHAEPSLGYGQQAADSRFYGKGRIKPHNSFYNFQSQLFDMLIHAWRWTGDAELENLLRPALEMHLQWQQECFDPDNDGLYESYINTWPTDSVWYAGGAGAEETAYAYTGHLAAASLAARAGDEAGAEKHSLQAGKIAKAFQERFWIPRKGYVGAYIEQTGHKRLHDDSWLYSIFLPIDAGLLSHPQSAQALHYTEWGLQRDKMPLGGERCWTSNWVPSVWSTRVLYPGDNYHLALAYFHAGLPEQGWTLLKGALFEAAYNGPVPGCPAISIGGTDFTDCTSMCARAVVEGLFGYKPRYDDQIAKIQPEFPLDWDHASIHTPDFSLDFKRTEGTDTYRVKLAKPARINLLAPLIGELVSMQVDGQAVQVEPLTGFDRNLVGKMTAGKSEAEFVIRWKDRIPPAAPQVINATVGQAITLAAPHGKIVQVEDSQQVLRDARIEDGAVVAQVADNPGHHMVLAVTETSPGAKQFHPFKLHVSEPKTETTGSGQAVREIPSSAKWDCIDLAGSFNGDIRTIYKQQYLSPRPDTCSVRIGSDGYSPWTFYYWNIKPPEIDLSNVPGMLKDGRIACPQGVPFFWAREAGVQDARPPKNIAFTSQWDNWPRSVSVPVGKQADAVWFLVCGTTNPMQTRIANGVIRLVYADGTADSLELIPPLNFWSLCPLRGADYDYKLDAFCLPAQPPATVQLGNNCRAMLLNRRLKPGVTLERVELETLSPEVIIGLMGVTLMSGS